MNDADGTSMTAPRLGRLAGQLVGWRPGRSRMFWSVVAVVSLLAVLLPVVMARPAFGVELPQGNVDWNAARQLPPLAGTDESSSPLTFNEIQPLVCANDECLATTLRPELEATIDPDPDSGYTFVVYDMTGAGGLESSVASVQGHKEATWAPQAGLLQDGHVYAWTVEGADDETQDFEVFGVDLRREAEQAFDEVGPFGVGLSTGELTAALGVGFGDDETDLVIEYTSADPAGRTVGSTPLHVVSDGWVLAGSALGGVSWYGLDIFAGGETIIAKSIDGTSVRYDRNADGDYVPPALSGIDIGYMYPNLVSHGDGSYSLSETTGDVSTFASDGTLRSVERNTPDGAGVAGLTVDWSGERLVSITDELTGRSASFTYLDERGCRPGQGFDNNSPDTLLCSFTTFDGERVELSYRQGRLSRIVAHGGAVTDFAYDASGRLVASRDALAADTVAAGLIADDPAATWRVTYDAAGKVASITSPVPAAGEQSLVRTYAYGDGTTTIAVNGVDWATITYDPADRRILTSRTSDTDAAFVRLYDDENQPVGYIDERGLQTSFETDADGNITTQWGPAPEGWFDEDGKPLATYADQIATQTWSYGGGQGVLGLFSDGLGADGSLSAQRLLTSATTTELPAAVDPTDGWRLTALGDARLSVEDDTVWRLSADSAADEDNTALAVNGMIGALGETIEVSAPDEIDPDGQLFGLWVVYASDTAPSPAAPAWFKVEYSSDDGQTWTELDVATLLGRDLPTAMTVADVYAAGAAPITRSDQVLYSDPLLGLVGTYSTNGTPTSNVTYEPADPTNGLFARPTSVTAPSGLTTAIEYWGVDDVVAHPISGQSLPQLGRERSVQTGQGAVHGQIFDAAGRLVAATVDGDVIIATLHDPRGRQEVIEAGDRTLTYQYGAGGDPRVTGTTSIIAGEAANELTTVDLLGRIRHDVDRWGTTSTMSYDHFGNVTEVVVEGADGAASVTTYTVDPQTQRLTAVDVAAADGNTYTATITGFDAAGRPTAIDYSNGASLAIDYDPVTGLVATHSWIDGNGDAWVDSFVRTTQSGRILEHALTDPNGSANFAYRYDASTGALTSADLSGTGDAPSAMSWTYTYDGIDGARTQRVTTSPDAIVTLDYGYNELLAPVAVTETTTPTGGETTTRDIPLAFAGDDLVAFDGTHLTYNAEGLLVTAADADTTIELTRDASGAIVRQQVTSDGVTTTFAYSGPFMVDATGVTIAQTIELPGKAIVSVSLADSPASWQFPTMGGDVWWTADPDGRPTGPAAHYSPDGEQLTGADADPAAVDTINGWRTGHGGITLALDTSVTVFGARAYLPALGLFTTIDPIPNAGPTPYSYADNDPVNLVDPTGNSSEGPFDNWNSPGWQVVITAVLTLVAMGLIALGQPHFAAVVMVLLAGYLGALSVDAFIQKDYYTGTAYAIAALLTLGAAYGLGFKSTTTTKMLYHKTSMTRSSSSGSIASTSRSFGHSEATMRNGAHGLAHQKSNATRQQIARVNTEAAKIDNNLIGAGLMDAPGAAPVTTRVVTLTPGTKIAWFVGDVSFAVGQTFAWLNWTYGQ